MFSTFLVTTTVTLKLTFLITHMWSPWVTDCVVQLWGEKVIELWQFLSLVNIQVGGAQEKKKKLYNMREGEWKFGILACVRFIKRHSLDFFSYAHAYLIALLSKVYPIFQWVMSGESLKLIAIQEQKSFHFKYWDFVIMALLLTVKANALWFGLSLYHNKTFVQ